MKNPRRKSHFNGWRTDILRMSKNIPRVHASTVSKAHFLKIADLGGMWHNRMFIHGSLCTLRVT